MEVVIRRARGFLEDGNKVRLVVRFRGRQITHPEFGQETLKKTIAQIEDVSKIDRDMHFEGKQLICILSPERKGKNAKEKNKEISKQTL